MSQLESFRVLPVDDDVRLLESMEAVLAVQSIERVNQCAGVAQLKRSSAALRAAVLGNLK